MSDDSLQPSDALINPGLCIGNRRERENINKFNGSRKVIEASHSHSMVRFNHRASR